MIDATRTNQPATVATRAKSGRGPRVLSGLLVVASLLAVPAASWADRGGPGRERPEFGRPVRVLPHHAHIVPYGGVRYGFHDGWWYAPGRGGYVVVRPPYGVVVADLPTLATLVTIAGVTYWYANDVYYRRAGDGGYEVVAPPAPPPPAQSERLYVYPTRGQSAEQQASDEYDCHRRAAAQSGFDPTAEATGTASGGSDPGRTRDYRRAQAACLEGRGYTVR